jgi:hypothetical protein
MTDGTIERRPMLWPWRYGPSDQYRMALHLSADWRLKAMDIDLFGYGLGEDVYFEYKGHLNELPERGPGIMKQRAQMSIIGEVAAGLRPGGLFHVAYLLEARSFRFWPKNAEAAGRMLRGGCPVEAGAILPDRYFEAFLYMSRGLQWRFDEGYEAVLEESLRAAIPGVLPA